MPLKTGRLPVRSPTKQKLHMSRHSRVWQLGKMLILFLQAGIRSKVEPHTNSEMIYVATTGFSFSVIGEWDSGGDDGGGGGESSIVWAKKLVVMECWFL